MNKKPACLLIAFALAVAAAPARAQIRINGYFSFQYQNGESRSESPNGEFGFPRAGLFFAGLVEKVFDYNLEVRFDDHDLVNLQEVWVGYVPSEAFHLKLGMYLVPFGTYNTSSRPYQTPLIQMPLAQAAIYPESWRDVGVLAEGRTGIFGYAVYMGNGLREAADFSSGQQFHDNNKDKGEGGRVTFELSRGFELGVSYNRSRVDDAGKRRLEYWAGHASWVTQGFRITYEYDWAEVENPAGFAKGKAEGHLVLATMNWGGFSPVVSYQKLDYRDPYHGTGFSAAEEIAGAGIDLADSRWAVGLVYTPVQSVMLKVEYDFNREKRAEIPNDLFLAQVALHF